MSKAKGLVWVAAACGVATGVALGLPWAATRVPWSVERWLGDLGAVPAHRCNSRSDPAPAAALDKVLRRIYPLDAADRSLPITVEILADPSVNAFATLGGHIYVYRGLLEKAQSGDELAAVLAHEIAHVRNRDVIQGVAVNLFTWGGLRAALPGSGGSTSEIAYLLLTLKFSRQQENQADEDGLDRLRNARVDPLGLARFFARLGRLESPPAIISNHPASSARAALAARQVGYVTEPVLTTDEWARLRHFCVGTNGTGQSGDSATP